MLGMTVETFRGNKIIIILLALIALILGFGIVADSEKYLRILSAVMLALMIFIIYWLWSVEITIFDVGILSKTFLDKKEMRWEDVTRFTYSATKQSVNFIPVGTYYFLELENARGQKIKIGNRASGMEKLARQLINCTLQPLLRKVVAQFNCGVEVDFGLIKLSKTKGFKTKGIFKSVEVPLNQLVGYRIEKGHFHVFRQGKKYAAISAPISKVPNAFVLLALLDSIFGN